MSEFSSVPPYDEECYHLSIIEKHNGKFVVYLDLSGLRYFQQQIINASKSRCGVDHGDIYVNGDRHFKEGRHKATVIRLFIDYPPRVSPHKPPMAYRMPGKVLEMAITLTDAKQLFERLDDMAKMIAAGKDIGRFDLPYGVAIEYMTVWKDHEQKENQVIEPGSRPVPNSDNQ